jgi:hypothetical protein
MTVATEFITMETAKRREKNRGVEFEWEIGTIPAGNGYAERKLVAELSISHRKAGANYFSGETTTEDHFNVTLTNVTVEDGPYGQTRGFTLFSGLGIGRIPAGNRYSAKKLREAEAKGVAMFLAAVEDGNEKVLRYFDPEKARERR